MPPAPSPARLPLLTVHPHQLGVQDFASYALILDVRTGRRFADDHIPGAVSAPLPARGRRAGRQLAPDQWRELIATLDPGSTIMIYAHAGERVLEAPTVWLRSQGLVVDVLPGGWLAYRRWVRASLEGLPRMFEIRVLSSSSHRLASAVLSALDDLGEQVIRLPAAPSQAALETGLLDTLRHRETHRRLWIVDPATGTPHGGLPPAFAEALRAAPRTFVSVQRAKTGACPPARDALVIEGSGATALRAAVEHFVSAFDAQSNP